jgi:hypothetical protein
MNWSGLSTIAVRVAGLFVFAHSLVAVMQSSQTLGLLILTLFLYDKPLSNYVSIFIPILPVLLFLCFGLLLFLKAGWIASWLGKQEPDSAEDGELRKLESVLIGAAGLYFLAGGIAEIGQVLVVFLTQQTQDWASRWDYLMGRNFALAAGGATKIVMGFAFVMGRAGLARLMRKARKPA